MFTIWKKISFIGNERVVSSDLRSLILTNQIAAILCFTAILVFFLMESLFIVGIASNLTLLIPIFIFPVWLLNFFGYINFSRYYLSIYLPLAVSVISVMTKLSDTVIDPMEYYDSRLFLLGTTFLPLILFEYHERLKLSLAILPGFFLLLLYDPIHEQFNVGYFQTGHKSNIYIFINYVIFIIYFFIGSCILLLKSIIFKAEKRNKILIEDLKKNQNKLKENNSHLYKLNKEISERNQAIEKQARKLQENQEHIFNASHIIAKQREELETKNQMLEVKLRSQDKSLLEINTELVKRNNELRQFGFTISHNLRGPIASMIGLSNLFRSETADPNNQEIINHIKEVCKNLDTIIKELNHIVEIRKDIQIESEPIDLEKEINVVLSTLKENIINSNAEIALDLNEKKIEGVKAYVHSIFYNLIDNSLKFRSRRRPLIINISSHSNNDNVVIKVEDNGIGFDVTQHYNDIFHLYKKFHSNSPGRGLGLYLTKLQTETLNGEIMVNSAVDKGTSFTIIFPAAQDGINH